LAVLDFGQLQEDNGHGKLSGYSGGLGNYHSTASLLFFQNLPALGQILRTEIREWGTESSKQGIISNLHLPIHNSFN
ncbi:MAG TPA: hypothetical protein VMT46_00060, partial [Anaerolineaceae bacterium]|nr:hypothetical protein [Anaerolineaceae bacterium]